MADDSSKAQWLGIPAPIWVIFVNAITLIILSERNHVAITDNGDKSTAAAIEAKVAASEAKDTAAEAKQASHENTALVKTAIKEQKKLPEAVARITAEAKKGDIYGDEPMPTSEGEIDPDSGP